MKSIFDTIELKNLHLKNRLIRSATWEALAEYDGNIDDDTYNIYRELAKGGVGAIITGFTSVSSDDFYFNGMMRLSDDKLIAKYKKLVEIIHAKNCAAISQLAMGAFYKNYVEVGENELSTDDVKNVIKMFVDAANRAKICGFDGVQIHAAHFFFLSRFISPKINHRKDEFGGWRSRQFMEKILNETNIELLSLSRPLVREPDLPKKFFSGESKILKCVSCNACYSTPAHRCIFVR